MEQTHYQKSYYFGSALSLLYRPLRLWLDHTYPLQITSITRLHTKGQLGLFYNGPSFLIFAGLHAGIASSIATVNEAETQYIVQTYDDDEEAQLEHNTLRGGVQFGVQFGKEQGFKLIGELGYTLEETQDHAIILGYTTKI